MPVRSLTLHTRGGQRREDKITEAAGSFDRD